MVEDWHLYVFSTALAYFSATFLINLCGKTKAKESAKGSPPAAGNTPGQPTPAAPTPQPPPPGVPPPQAPKPPAAGGVAGTYDPNYQTLANIQGDVFGADKKAAAAPAAGAPGGGGGGGGAPEIKPGAGGMAGTYDPNYQTLAGIGGDVFGADKKAAAAPAGGGAAPPPQIKPGAGGMAGTYDPNYQTLANMNADVFGKDKKA